MNGQKGRFQCRCLLRSSDGSVDSLIGKIRAIFQDLGLGISWNESLGTGNPAAAHNAI